MPYPDSVPTVEERLAAVEAQVQELRESRTTEALALGVTLVHADTAAIRADVTAVQAEMATRADLTAMRGELAELSGEVTTRLAGIETALQQLLSR